MAQFDAFAFVSQHASNKAPTVKAHGYNVKLVGMPDAWTLDAVCDLARESSEPLPVSMPRTALEGANHGQTVTFRAQLAGGAAAAFIAGTDYSAEEGAGKRRANRKRGSKAEDRAGEGAPTNGTPVEA